MNIEDDLSSLAQHLDLHSLSIGGGMITAEGIEHPIGLDQFTFSRIANSHSRFIHEFQLRLTPGSLN